MFKNCLFKICPVVRCYVFLKNVRKTCCEWPPYSFGTTTFSLTTRSITTFSITKFSITTRSNKTFRITKFSITTFSIMTISIKGLFVTLRINDIKHKKTLSTTRQNAIVKSGIMLNVTFYWFLWWVSLCVMLLSWYAECRYAEYHYPECRGTVWKERENIKKI